MNLEAYIPRPEIPPLDRRLLKQLSELRIRLEKRANGDVSPTEHRPLEEMRQRLKLIAPRSGAVFADRFVRATAVTGRERLLLRLYLLDEGQPRVREYLPPFDDRVCTDLLGSSEISGTLGGLRVAVAIFFTHFDRLHDCPSLGHHIQSMVARLAAEDRHPNKLLRWRECCHWLFSPDGPEKLVSRLDRGEKLEAVLERYGVPCPSRFSDAAQQHYLFGRLQKLPLGQKDETLFNELTSKKEQPLSNRELVGARALRVLIRRCLSENHGRLPESWGTYVGALGCDPRLSRRSEEFRKWWSWANPADLDVVLPWFTRTELGAFLKLLRSSLGANAERMFKARDAFLRRIFDAGKIRDARLVLVDDALRDARSHFGQQVGTSFARMRTSSDGVSVICLRLDGFFMVEGTHNFALRLFRNFPVRGFWERESSEFVLSQFQHGADARIPHQGAWESKFQEVLMQAPFRIFWPDVQ